MSRREVGEEGMEGYEKRREGAGRREGGSGGKKGEGGRGEPGGSPRGFRGMEGDAGYDLQTGGRAPEDLAFSFSACRLPC